MAVQALYASTTTTSDDEYIQADTEDSDVNDPELGRADYWECVKCKNKQNNPLYRYCERCYQVGVVYLYIYKSYLNHIQKRDRLKQLWFIRKSNHP